MHFSRRAAALPRNGQANSAKPGAPKGRANGAYRHDGFTKEAIDGRVRLRDLLKRADSLTGSMRQPRRALSEVLLSTLRDEFLSKDPG
jgi:hypothetical protein